MLLTTSFSHLVNSRICGALDHRFPLLLQARMRETTMVMLFSLCVGMYVCPSSCGAQECGNNPMKQVLSVAKRTGKIGERPSTYHSLSTKLCHENSVKKRRVYTHGGHRDIKNRFHEELSQWNPQSWRPLHRFYNSPMLCKYEMSQYHAFRYLFIFKLTKTFGLFWVQKYIVTPHRPPRNPPKFRVVTCPVVHTK